MKNKLALLTLLALAALPVSAVEVTVEWTNPIKNTDESPIDSTGAYALASTRVEWGSCNGAEFGTKEGDVSVAAPATSTKLQLAPGSWCVRAFAINASAAESAASNVTVNNAAMPTPCPPELADEPATKGKAKADKRRGKATRLTIERE
jgi:hypothetical protein